MKLSRNLAQDITEEIKSIINQDINYFNGAGYIIASTDRDRIGDFHQGAKKVLDNKKELIVEYDDQYKGARKGINLPVYFMKDVVGVIGITGSKEEVEHYGKIIQKMTELLIKDAYVQEKRLTDKENREEFLKELIFNQQGSRDSVYRWAELLDFKIERRAAVVVASIYNEEFSLLGSELYDKALKIIEDFFTFDRRNIVMKSGKNIIIVCHFKNINLMEERINELNLYISNKYRDINVLFGMGNMVEDIEDLKDSYYEAEKTLNIGRYLKDGNVFRYDSLDIELIIDCIPEEIGNIFLEKIFKDIEDEDIIKYGLNLFKYVEHNGSINKAADDLFIHKNTLQYRLDNIYRLTQYNPRDLKDMIILYIGFSLHKYS